ncbi:NAD dependent epimerase/dehydratase [Auriculariales sp. MPI-PUGE-AT-0066]|nr:NAD dependent epimerase/dehydratase [Auriculariales sp. MPI-PUGE-AT-0066]
MSTFLVTGATGRQGGSTVRELLAAGANVRALVRDETKPEVQKLAALGASLFVAKDYNDEATIARAVVDVEGIFLNPMPDFINPDAERAWVQRFIDAARSVSPGKLRTLVISTVSTVSHHAEWLAEDPSYPMHNYSGSKLAAEEAVRASGVPNITILRPPWLMSNYLLPMLYFHFPSVAAGGEIIEMRTPMGLDNPIAHLDPRDIGRLASAALLHPERFAGKTLAPGWKNVTIVEVAREIEAVTGRKIRVVHQDVEELKRSDDPVKKFLGSVAEWRNVRGHDLTDGELNEVRALGFEPRSLRTFLEDHKELLWTTVPN